MNINIVHDGLRFSSVEAARERGVPAAMIGAALKVTARAQMASVAETYRVALASASAGKQSEYRLKEEIARAPEAAPEVELAMLDREAVARGIDRATLLAEILTRAAAHRQISLLIGALEAEGNAALAAVPDAATDIEAQMAQVLQAARGQLEAAFAEAQASLIA